VPPLLPTLVETPPVDDGWVHEIKHDGFRTVLVIEDERCRDLLFLDGKDLRDRPLGERKAMLDELIGVASPYSAVQVSEHFEGGGAALFAAAERMGLEGIVSTRVGSRYKSGRSSLWAEDEVHYRGRVRGGRHGAQPGGAPLRCWPASAPASSSMPAPPS
jgi:ATP-dependent DNA ligase